MADKFEAVYILPGNHEYYGGYDAATAMHTTLEPVKDNVFLINNASVENNGPRMLTNQLGYVGWGEHRAFRRDKVV